MRFRLELRSLSALVVIGLALVSHHSTQAACANTCVRLQDEIIEVNTRPSGCTTDPERFATTMQVKELVLVGNSGESENVAGGYAARKWVHSDFSRLTEISDPDRVTVVYVHGNKIDHCDTRRRSLDVYRALVARSCDERPIRFVIWSWPASEIPGFLKDFRVKASRTTQVGWQLAWGLDQFPVEGRVSLLGYSYGARAIGGAMHLLAGGEMSGLILPDRADADSAVTARPPMRVAFIAAATHAEWFGPGRYHGLAMTQIDQLLLVKNARDPAMKFYKFTTKNGSPQALGLKGPTCLDSESWSRVRCIDCTNSVSRTHDLYKYMANRRMMTRTWRHLSYADEAVIAP